MPDQLTSYIRRLFSVIFCHHPAVSLVQRLSPDFLRDSVDQRNCLLLTPSALQVRTYLDMQRVNGLEIHSAHGV